MHLGLVLFINVIYRHEMHELRVYQLKEVFVSEIYKQIKG